MQAVAHLILLMYFVRSASEHTESVFFGVRVVFVFRTYSTKFGSSGVVVVLCFWYTTVPDLVQFSTKFILLVS